MFPFIMDFAPLRPRKKLIAAEIKRSARARDKFVSELNMDEVIMSTLDIINHANNMVKLNKNFKLGFELDFLPYKIWQIMPADFDDFFHADFMIKKAWETYIINPDNLQSYFMFENFAKITFPQTYLDLIEKFDGKI